MKPSEYNPLLHRFAVATLLLAFLPIIVGALVTTMDAGMAFRDWPSSDGHNLFFYPWLKSAGDKFLEHGHRLAGALIGFVAIGLALIAWKTETRKSVRMACYYVLLAVVIQGLLGGGRVRLDTRTLAMVHGSFAALVFGLMAGVAVVTSRAWVEGTGSQPTQELKKTHLPMLSAFASVACLAIFLQYLVGGLVRHLGRGLHEHLAGAFLVTLLTTATAIAAYRSQFRPLKKAGWLMFACLVLQVSLGLGAWVMKFGFTPLGYVAVVNSTPQVVLRTAHTVSGMLLFASAVALKLHTVRIRAAESQSIDTRDAATPRLADASLTLEGGLR